MSWTVFASIYDGFAVPMIALTNVMIGTLGSWVIGWMREAMLVLIVGTLIWASLKGGADPFSILLTELVKYWFVGVLITSALGLGPALRDLVLRGIEGEIGGALLGATGGRVLNGVLFDEMWNKAFAGGLRVMRDLPWSIAGAGMMLTVLGFWFVALVSTIILFAVWMKAFIMTAFLIGFWPIFIGLWVFPWFRFLFWGYVHSLFANLILKIFTTVLLSVIMNGLMRLLQTMLATSGGAGPGLNVANEWLQLQTLMGAGALLACAGWLAYQLPGLASSISHGFAGYGHMTVTNLGLAFGKGGGGAGGEGAGRGGGGHSDYNRSGSGSGSGGSPANGSIPVVRNAPPGRSLSND